MKIYKNAKIFSVSYNEDPVVVDEDLICEVKFGEGRIVVSYKDDEGDVIYRGNEDGEGHYLLECAERDGKASLHMFSKSEILEGHWKEGDYRGFWRITLE
ncbi:MAG: hypothetical protein HQK84_07035 [Nitrospinae bacterium]|nr:hypothetical protein [Nitrospinota bacterium]